MRARNPQAPRSIARFSHRDLLFKNDPTIDQIALIYRYEGCAENENGILDVFTVYSIGTGCVCLVSVLFSFLLFFDVRYLAHRVESEAGREQADKEEAVLEVQRFTEALHVSLFTLIAPVISCYLQDENCFRGAKRIVELERFF